MPNDSAQLQEQVRDLQQEMLRLRANNDELSADLAQNVRSMIQESGGGGVQEGSISASSLAAELSDASKDDLVERLRKQEQANECLRGYLNRLLNNVIERDPGILEIKSEED